MSKILKSITDTLKKCGVKIRLITNPKDILAKICFATAVKNPDNFFKCLGFTDENGRPLRNMRLIDRTGDFFSKKEVLHRPDGIFEFSRKGSRKQKNEANFLILEYDEKYNQIVLGKHYKYLIDAYDSPYMDKRRGRGVKIKLHFVAIFGAKS
jgi:hypothetical protein